MGRGDMTEAQIQSICEKLFSSAAFLDRIVGNIVTEVASRLEQRFNNINTKVGSLETRLATIENRLDSIEQNARSCNLLVSGLPVTDPDKVKTEVINMCKHNLCIQVSANDIQSCRSIFNKDRSYSSLVVKFYSKQVRDNIFRSKSKLKGTKLVIREDLIPSRYKLFQEASRLFGKSNVWTSNGKIIGKYGRKTVTILKPDDLINYK